MIETRWVALTDGLGTNQKLLYAKNGFFRSYKFVAQTDGGGVRTSIVGCKNNGFLCYQLSIENRFLRR